MKRYVTGCKAKLEHMGKKISGMATNSVRTVIVHVATINVFRDGSIEPERAKVGDIAISGILPVIGNNVKTLGVWQLRYRFKLCALKNG